MKNNCVNRTRQHTCFKEELCVLSPAVFSVLLMYWCKICTLQKVSEVLKAEQERMRQDMVVDDKTGSWKSTGGRGRIYIVCFGISQGFLLRWCSWIYTDKC